MLYSNVELIAVRRCGSSSAPANRESSYTANATDDPIDPIARSSSVARSVDASAGTPDRPSDSIGIVDALTDATEPPIRSVDAVITRDSAAVEPNG